MKTKKVDCPWGDELQAFSSSGDCPRDARGHCRACGAARHEPHGKAKPPGRLSEAQYRALGFLEEGPMGPDHLSTCGFVKATMDKLCERGLAAYRPRLWRITSAGRAAARAEWTRRNADKMEEIRKMHDKRLKAERKTETFDPAGEPHAR